MNKLQSLKEEARAEFHIILDADSSDDDWLDSIIDRTYHATKEEVRGMVKGLDSGMATVSNEAAYELCKQDILAALEDTTTSPNN